jgi:hypothetical protein
VHKSCSKSALPSVTKVKQQVITAACSSLIPLKVPLFFNAIPQHIDASVQSRQEFKHSVTEEITLLHSQSFMKLFLLPHYCDISNHPTVDLAAY